MCQRWESKPLYVLELANEEQADGVRILGKPVPLNAETTIQAGKLGRMEQRSIAYISDVVCTILKFRPSQDFLL